MTPRRAGRLVLEFWRSSGKKTEARIVALSAHVAAQYRLDARVVEDAARAGIFQWERDEMKGEFSSS